MTHKRKIINSLIAVVIATLVFMTGCSLFEGLEEIIEEASKTPAPSGMPTGTAEPTKVPDETSTPVPTPVVTSNPTPTPSATPLPGYNPAEDIEKLDVLEEYIERYFSQFDGRYGLTFLDISTGNQMNIASYDQYIAASTSKLPINLYLFKKIAEGALSFDIEMEYLEQDLEYGTGLIIKGDYGDKYTVAQLVEYSLVYSDNCAINMIIRLCGRDNILDYMMDLGATINYGLRHRSCPADMAVFAKELYDRNIENPGLYGIMVNYLENTVFNDRINRYLPAGVPVAHKIGNYINENAYNDIGIVYADNPYIVSLMSEQTNENLEAFEVLAQTSLMIYRFMEGEEYESVMNPVTEARPEAFSFEYDTVNPNGYDFNELISFGDPDDYQDAKGVLTFRGNNYRNGGAYGTVDIDKGELGIIWSFDVGVIDNWPGTGWTGQPSIIEWPQETVALMNVFPQFKGSSLKEVIYAAMDGFIYFCELETGEWTRPPIEIGFPTKGSVTVDPRGYPIFYTGQGVDYNGEVYGLPKYRMFSLIDQSLIYEIPGYDSSAYRGWYAFDSSGLLYIEEDIYIECAENGLIYIMKLNTQYDKTNGTISVNPETIKYRYKNPINGRLGIENSPAIYKNYIFFADNGGLLQCLDLNTLKPVWLADLGDDTDASIVLEEDGNKVYIYVSSEFDLRGKAAQLELEQAEDIVMESYVRKFNALTGELVWETSYDCWYDSYINGGFLATPVVGTNDINDRIIINVAKTGTKMGGRIAALDKDTGLEIWALVLPNYSWSSPTAIKDTDSGKTYILHCNFSGTMRLIDPLNGTIISEVSLGANIESTPAVFNDIAVVGSYAKKIFGIRIN
ncbi:MAG: serine hydrolase [Clostridia bacterium]|nr:serine hydrolase [Clostridia bacterium]MBN2883608.1 serine hydrolase [Clostridia bacterium]